MHTQPYPNSGSIAALGVFGLGLVYALVTALGLLALQTPLEPISDPIPRAAFCCPAAAGACC